MKSWIIPIYIQKAPVEPVVSELGQFSSSTFKTKMAIIRACLKRRHVYVAVAVAEAVRPNFIIL